MISFSSRFFRALAYLFVSAAGVAVFILNVVENVNVSLLGTTLTIVWVLFLITAVPAAWAAMFSRFRVEYIMLPWFVGGMFVAATVAWYRILFLSATANAPAALFFSALCFFLVARWFLLSDLVTVHRLNMTEQGHVAYTFFQNDADVDGIGISEIHKPGDNNGAEADDDEVG